MGHIFISYSHKDTDYVHKLRAVLQKEGFEVWIDDHIDYGEEWPIVIQERLDECDAFILVATENSFNSKWVRKEVTRAQRIDKAFFPLLLSGHPWLSIESTQYVDVRNKSLPTEKFYKQLEAVAPRKKVVIPLPSLPPQTPKQPSISKDAIAKFIVRLFPVIRLAAVFLIVGAILWAGSWGVPKLIQLMPTAKSSLTPTLHPSATLTFSPQPPTETLTSNPISTDTKTSSPAPIWPIIGNWLIKYQFGCSGNTNQFTLDVRPNGVLFTSSGNEGTWVNYGNYVDMQISTTTIVRYTGKISEDTMSGTMYGINGCWNAQRIK